MEHHNLTIEILADSINEDAKEILDFWFPGNMAEGTQYKNDLGWVHAECYSYGSRQKVFNTKMIEDGFILDGIIIVYGRGYSTEG